MRLIDNNEASSRLREQFGLVSHTYRQAPDDAKQPVQTMARRKSRRPGQRRSSGDAVGKPGAHHAAHAWAWDLGTVTDGAEPALFLGADRIGTAFVESLIGYVERLAGLMLFRQAVLSAENYLEHGRYQAHQRGAGLWCNQRRR
jgi:hypothetical protein